MTVALAGKKRSTAEQRRGCSRCSRAGERLKRSRLLPCRRCFPPRPHSTATRTRAPKPGAELRQGRGSRTLQQWETQRRWEQSWAGDGGVQRRCASSGGQAAQSRGASAAVRAAPCAHPSRPACSKTRRWQTERRPRPQVRRIPARSASARPARPYPPTRVRGSPFRPARVRRPPARAWRLLAEHRREGNMSRWSSGAEPARQVLACAVQGRAGQPQHKAEGRGDKCIKTQGLPGGGWVAPNMSRSSRRVVTSVKAQPSPAAQMYTCCRRRAAARPAHGMAVGVLAAW